MYYPYVIEFYSVKYPPCSTVNDDLQFCFYHNFVFMLLSAAKQTIIIHLTCQYLIHWFFTREYTYCFALNLYNTFKEIGLLNHKTCTMQWLISKIIVIYMYKFIFVIVNERCFCNNVLLFSYIRKFVLLCFHLE